MAITNYTELQSSVTNWLSRTNDANLIALYPDFITLAESKLNRVLRTYQMEASSSIAPVAGVVALPADYLELRRIYVDESSKIELQYITPEQFHEFYPSGDSSSRFYTIEGTNILLADDVTTANVSILYYQKIPALTVSNTTNWLLTAHPDIYLAAVLSEAYDVIKNESQAQKWWNKAEVVVNQLISSDKKAKQSGSTMRVIAA